jgi:peptidoglycan-associated lipoprotein
MRRSCYSLALIAIAISTLLITTPGCGRKVGPTVPATKTESAPVETPKAAENRPTAPAPTITLNVSPSAIEKGQSTTLSWNSSNATNVSIDNGVGTVEPSGSREIKPAISTTYMARATGLGGSAVAEARVTVTPPAAATPAPRPAISDAEIFASSIKDAFFDYDQYSIRSDAQEALQADARILNERPNIRVTIEGHCDERGSEKYNLALGDRRANAARDYMVGLGVNSSRVDTISYGKERNFCEEHNEECWQLNRRAHLVMR